MALAPANQDIYYYNGDSRTKSYTVTDVDGAAVDLSGDTLTLTVKKKKCDSSAVATLSTALEITISGASNNVVNIAMGNLPDLDERSYFYDLYNNTDGDTIMYGKLIVTKEVHD
jgi:hypothetical protein